MNILALDTTGPVAGVALMQQGVITHEITACHGLTHSQTLMTLVDETLSAAQLTAEALDLIACVAGPGSFTGVRIGVCAARALSHAWGVSCARLDALEVLAMGAYGFEGLICPILDARRGQVYSAAFSFCEGDAPVRRIEDGARALEDFALMLPAGAPLLFTGDGVAAYAKTLADMLGARARFAPPHMRYLRAAAACTLAQARPDTRVEMGALTPIYLRAPQAERERARRLKEAQDG